MRNIENRFYISSISYIKNGHIWNGSKCCHVIYGLMSYTARGHDAREKTNEGDREIWICNTHLQLIQNTAVQKHTKAVQERPKALSREASSPADHVLFFYSKRKISFGIDVFKLFNFA